MGNTLSSCKSDHCNAVRQAVFGDTLVDQFRKEMYCSLLEDKELHTEWMSLIDELEATW